jgi:excisionase family DNA binding protein
MSTEAKPLVEGQGGESVIVAVKPKKKPQDRTPRPPPYGVFLYRIEEAAYLLQLSVTTVQRLVAKGKLSFRSVSSRGEGRASIRFAPADLESFIGGVGAVRGEPETPEFKAARRAKNRGISIDPRVMEQEAKSKGRGAKH